MTKKPIWQSSIARNITDDSKFTTILIKYLFPFTASALLGFAGPGLMDLTKKENIALLVVAALSLILWGLFITVLKLIAVEEQRNTHRVSVSKDDPFNTVGRITAFDYCTAAAKKAKKSIYVVGPHFSNTLRESPGSESHDNYLTDGMTSAIKRHSRDEETGFIYFRILQLDPDMMDTVRPEGEISKHAIADDSLAKHIDECLNLERGFSEIEIHARNYVPSLPSILVIDDQYVFFSLPTHIRLPEQGDYDFVFEIEDKSGIIPNQFKTVIRSLKGNHSTQIKNIT